MNNSLKLLSLTAFLLYNLVEADSNLDVNSNQHATFMDGDDEIEDYSEDAILDELEKEEQQNEKPTGSSLASLLGGGIGGIIGDSSEFDDVDDYVEEYTDKGGNHMRKEVHKGDGWETISISKDDSEGDGDPFGGDFMAELLGAIMAE